MTTVNYTLDAYPASSLVDGIYYDENTQALTIDLNDDIYTYAKVPVDEFYTFVAAASAGKHYPYIKRTYGPAEKVGVWDEINFKRVNKPATDTVGTPKGLTDDTINVAVNSNRPGLITGGTYVTNTTNTFSLTAPETEAVLDHVVEFTVNGQEKAHTVKTTSVDEAVGALNEIADMLDLTFVIKTVTVHFE